MKIYIAASVKAQRDAVRLAIALKAHSSSLVITSRWIHEKYVGYEDNDESRLTTSAVNDLEDIDDADVLILLAQPNSETGGAHTEFGYAFAKSKRVILYGERVNVFHYHPMVEVFSDFKEMVESL